MVLKLASLAVAGAARDHGGEAVRAVADLPRARMPVLAGSIMGGEISVAAEDTLATFPGAVINFASAADITNANNQNAYPNLPVSGTLKVIYSAPGVVSLGCAEADYGTLPPNTVVAIQRGDRIGVTLRPFGREVDPPQGGN